MQRIYKFLTPFIILAILLSFLPVPVMAQEGDTTDPEVEAIFGQMSPEERVGQLFLVTFYGADITPGSDIALLITQYHVGGVVLLEENDNFDFESRSNLPLQVQQMTGGLQLLAAGQSGSEAQGSGNEGDVSTPEPSNTYLPLFIAVEHEGNSTGHMSLQSIATSLPSNMAIGATWDPAFARSVGQISGKELDALGINFLLGPDADVVEEPQPFTSGDLGVRTFGGEPFWVAQMVKAYVIGVHEGSGGRVAVIPKHFPGHGNADRVADVEVPTIRRSLDDLKRFDLIPFFTVTDNTADPLAQADGVMSGHIRYRGFQGENRLLETRPISLDSQNLPILLQLAPIVEWHQAGGLVVSDSLGVRGIRRLYDPQEQTFYNRRITRDALYAGNDLLYLSEFGINPKVDQTDTIIATIDYFVQQYQADPGFQARVDEAARRIIRKKLDLYGSDFALDNVLPAEDQLENVGQETDITLSVAQNALTLLSPDQSDLLTSPQSGDSFIIFTDTHTIRLCSSCPEESLITVDTFQNTILRLYGPDGTGQIRFSDINSFSFEELDNYLDIGPQETTGEDQTPVPDSLTLSLNSAEWVVFVMLGVKAENTSTNVVKRFLAESPVSPGTQIVVLSMGAPYYLDQTEIGKLSAYYALYGYSRSFVDVAARALFQQASFNGASPVSVPGIEYKIYVATSPDPAQLIQIAYTIERPEPETVGTPDPATPTLTPSPTPEVVESGVRFGDILRLNTGVIVDYNGNPVPDGTPVEFIFNYTGGTVQTASVTTVEGVARTSLSLNTSGELIITAQSIEALISDTLKINVPTGTDDTGSIVYQSTGTRTPTPTPTELPTYTPAPGTPVPTPIPISTPPLKSVTFADLFLSIIGLTAIFLAAFVFSFVRMRDLNRALIIALFALIFGFVGYNYYALLLPGALAWRGLIGKEWSAALAAWLFAMVGIGLTYLGITIWSKLLAPIFKAQEETERKA